MSIILAKVFGIYFFIVALAALINPDRFRRLFQQSMQDQNFLLLGGILALLIGAIVVSVHNIWVLAWPVIITFFGWWSLIKGAALLIYPESINLFSSLQNRSELFYRGVGLLYLLLSLFLLYKGFWVW